MGGGRAGFDFTKLDADGNDLSASAEEWSCVRDNHTGLIWEVKTMDGGLRDMSNSYSWYNPDFDTNGGNTGRQNYGRCSGSECDTQSYIDAVNTQGLCGANDWQLPTRQQLQSIVVYSFTNPTIDSGYFPHNHWSNYWSSSPSAQFGFSAWSVNLDYGEIDSILKNQSLSIRLVRNKGN